VKAILRALPYLLLSVVLSGPVILTVVTVTPQSPLLERTAMIQFVEPTPTPSPTPPPTDNECEHIFCG
jgi:hypothetical protein